MKTIHKYSFFFLWLIFSSCFEEEIPESQSISIFDPSHEISSETKEATSLGGNTSPLLVWIRGDRFYQQGGSVTLTSEVWGGDGNYTYNWVEVNYDWTTTPIPGGDQPKITLNFGDDECGVKNVRLIVNGNWDAFAYHYLVPDAGDGPSYICCAKNFIKESDQESCMNGIWIEDLLNDQQTYEIGQNDYQAQFSKQLPAGTQYDWKFRFWENNDWTGWFSIVDNDDIYSVIFNDELCPGDFFQLGVETGTVFTTYFARPEGCCNLDPINLEVDNQTICIGDLSQFKLSGIDGGIPFYTVEWFYSSQTIPLTSEILTTTSLGDTFDWNHTLTTNSFCSDKFFVYATVTDSNGCTITSNTVPISMSDCSNNCN